jgi:SAM-dependent methyltransferase
MNFSNCPHRWSMSNNYLEGSGIEIAPLHSAWPIPTHVQVRYVDRYTREQLIQQYPELDARSISETQVIDDARVLEKFEADSLDFIINSHVFEHCDNPIRTLERWLQVVRPGGCILFAIPNKEHTFDKDRPLTRFEELVDAYCGGTEFKVNALRSFFKHVDKLDGEALELAVNKAREQDSHVHFPVWNQFTFLDFLVRTKKVMLLDYEIEFFLPNGFEMFTVLRRKP